MSPNTFGQLGLSITGLGTQYPPYALKPDAIDILAKRYHADSPSMKKTCAINQFTGIDTRSSIGNPDHPVVNHPDPPSIADLHEVFMNEGVPLAVSAARKAISEARIDLEEITHIVSTTCTDSGNPGFDHFVCQDLGIAHQVEKVLLHGVGCAGGLTALRTAANLALGHSFRGKPARILVLALEVSTTMVRSELDSIDKLQETRIGVCLFSDCASAVVLSNGLGDELCGPRPPVYELLGWDHRIIPDTTHDLGFDVDPVGWKVVLSQRVPKLAAGSLQPTFTDLMSSLKLPPPWTDAKPADFDWAMHPGGATILSGAEKALGLVPEHMRASYDTYINHGNSSSATVFSVLDHLRSKSMDACTPDGRGPKEYVIGCAFGPGVAVEMCMLKRNLGVGPEDTGLQTPPETESEESSERSEDGEDSVQSDEVDIGAVGSIPSSSGRGGNGEANVNGETFISQALEAVELD
ncbi:5,7-dihydroxy-2-methylchromone synthase [Cytospora mali]|uniref:5,7-dihydroxy-2-methylchromone synthase n=1 Tax=Cytospora mali TaxID=578113 RepID=A0A194VDY8_CYTMA|nr:5,7-dihydroxy-2-methylchromone synthase [Valsa mali var. pyri (nom. inval.)]